MAAGVGVWVRRAHAARSQGLWGTTVRACSFDNGLFLQRVTREVSADRWP